MKNIISTMEQKQSRYTTLATEYLKSKGAPSYYVVTYLGEEGGFDPSEYKMITDEQRAELEAAQAQYKAEECDLREHFADCDVPEYLAFSDLGDNCLYDATPIEIEFDVRYVKCGVKVAAFYDGIDNAPKVYDTYMFLTEAEYIQLLAWQMANRRCNFNDLLGANYELFSIINQKIRGGWSKDYISPIDTPIFAVDLVECKQDALKALGEPSVHYSIYEKFTNEKSEMTLLDIEERVLAFHYSSGGNDQYCYWGVENVDAIAVERAFGVDSYRDIAEHMTAEFGDAEGVAKFQKYLDDNKIDYKLNKEC